MDNATDPSNVLYFLSERLPASKHQRIYRTLRSLGLSVWLIAPRTSGTAQIASRRACRIVGYF
jgi:hypothetical protein